MSIAIVPEVKYLGYRLSCNGETCSDTSRLIGKLRGSLARLRDFGHCSSYAISYWWKTQFRGDIGWIASHLGPSKIVFRELDVISNGGARRVRRLIPLDRRGQLLESIHSEFSICLVSFFAQSVVGWLGHVFRHPTTPVAKLLSLPIMERLTHFRVINGRRSAASESAEMAWETLENFV